MGHQTVTTVTCDQCDKDITGQTQVLVNTSSQTISPEGISDAMTQTNAVLCEEHGSGLTTKVNALLARNKIEIQPA